MSGRNYTTRTSAHGSGYVKECEPERFNQTRDQAERGPPLEDIRRHCWRGRNHCSEDAERIGIGGRMIRQTRTHVLLELSAKAYDEIKEKLLEAGYEHAVLDSLPDHRQERIDMHGIAIITTVTKGRKGHKGRRMKSNK